MHYLTYICHKKGYLGLFRGEEKASRQKNDSTIITASPEKANDAVCDFRSNRNIAFDHHSSTWVAASEGRVVVKLMIHFGGERQQEGVASELESGVGARMCSLACINCWWQGKDQSKTPITLQPILIFRPEIRAWLKTGYDGGVCLWLPKL